MNSQTILSFRSTTAFAKKVSAFAKKLGVSRSEYTRIAVEELNRRVMSDRIKVLSIELSAQSLVASEAMDDSIGDGLSA